MSKIKSKKSTTPKDENTMIAPKAAKLPDGPSFEEVEKQHHIEHLGSNNEHANHLKQLATVLVVAGMAIAAGTFIGLSYFDSAQETKNTAYLASEHGHVSEYEGSAEISYNNGINWRPLEGTPHISPGVHVRTLVGSSTKINFGQNSSIELGELSQIAVKSFNNIKVSVEHVEGQADVVIDEAESWTFELLNSTEKSVTAQGSFSSSYGSDMWELSVNSGWLKHDGSQTSSGLQIPLN